MTWCLTLVTMVLVGAACEPVAEGEVRVTMSGGDGTQRGYASHLFQDGWSVQFTKYLVSLGDFTLTSASGEKRTAPGHVLVDVQKGDVALTALRGLAAGRWSVGFRVSPPREDTTLPDGNVSAEDLARMRARGYSYWVEGIAVKPDVGVYSFRMGFPVDVRMVDCVNGVDGTLGIVVPENSVAEAEVTIHAEHMFYDRLGTHRGVQLRFDALAATADADKVITPEGLASQDLLDLRGLDGRELKDNQGRPVVYEPGAYTVRTLQEFVTQSIVDQAHLNGGGVCTVAH
ncbi:hypothetical protein [Vitiosangium sp. GDMCC 1.1324]|uniref:hypothetical protein n=1 Tax=Vitiosangium sp. (strain GDMCC 1.1324) TaxID=2138576 RepID=UPI000D3C8843|nr:hypothetical protein [Vitiosangium sp. GDMCC 1.1324]PTL80665.1 hypothetical protein DAT35_29005 [Vitiosangium sp. GDMCC 1.1324]